MEIYTKFTEHLWCGWESKANAVAGEKPLSIRCLTSDQAEDAVKGFFKAKELIDAPLPSFSSPEQLFDGVMVA